MGFISKEEFGSAIKRNVLDSITEFDDNKLEVTMDEAISFMKGHLNARYDTEKIFSARGAQRNPVVMRYVKSITIYYLHDSLSQRNLPEHRETAYNHALIWLDGVKDKTINPDLPLLESGVKDDVLWGSNPKRSNHI